MGENGRASMLTCVYCGAELESTPPYAVMYCDCRTESPRATHAAPVDERQLPLAA
jgi:hypothetical protein